MIKEMSVQQAKDVQKWREEWLAIGRSTQPINREKVEAVISKMYRKADKLPPKFIYLPSIWACLKQSGPKNQGQLNNYFAGGMWCAWEVFYAFCRHIGVKYTPEQDELLDLWLEQSRECHWWFPYTNAVLVSERPIVLHLDGNGRLHSRTEAAAQYKDGFSLFAIDGIRVPRKVVLDPASLTPKEILEETNVEVRRIMLSQYGTGKFLLASKAKILDEDQDSHGLRTLFSLDIPNDETLVMFRVHCRRKDGEVEEYMLRVNPKITTCKDAFNYTYPQGFIVKNQS